MAIKKKSGIPEQRSKPPEVDPAEADPDMVMITTPESVRETFDLPEEMPAGEYEKAIKIERGVAELNLVDLKTQGAATDYKNEMIINLNDPNNAHVVEQKLLALKESVAKAVALARKDKGTLEGLDKKGRAALESVDVDKVAALIIADAAKASIVKKMRPRHNNDDKNGGKENEGELTVQSGLPRNVGKGENRGVKHKQHSV